MKNLNKRRGLMCDTAADSSPSNRHFDLNFTGLRVISWPFIVVIIGMLMLCPPLPAGEVQWENSLKPKGEPGPKLQLSLQGAAKYSILVPEVPSPQEAEAADELSHWLKEMSGCEFQVIREGGNYQPSEHEISLGMTKRLHESGLKDSVPDLKEEGYAIAQKEGRLFLWGGAARGPLYAVYALLEEDLGCRWYTPDYVPGGSVIPKSADLTVNPVTRHFVPQFALRDPYYYDVFDQPEWALRNRTNPVRADIPGNLGGFIKHSKEGIAHTFHLLLPPEKYWENHPEYYASDGQNRKPHQMCLTNPEVLKIVTANVLAELRASPGVKFFDISQDDGWPQCHCVNCKAINKEEGAKSGALLKFVNRIAESIEKEFPEVKITTLAYLDTLMPPKTVRPRKNVIIFLCTDSHTWLYPFVPISESGKFLRAFHAWAATGSEFWIWDYTTNFSNYPMPMPNMEVVSSNIRFFAEGGASGVLLQGAYHTVGSDNASLRCWVWAKQLWDPTRDTRSLMKDFIFGFYGSAGDPMWRYNELLYEIWTDNSEKPRRLDTSEKVNPLMVQNLGGIRYGPRVAFLSEEFLRQSSLLLDEAERKADSAELLEKVKMAKLPILYVKVCQGLGTVNDFEFKPGSVVASRDPAGIEECQKLVDELEAVVLQRTRVGAFSERDTALDEIWKWRKILEKLRLGEELNEQTDLGWQK